MIVISDSSPINYLILTGTIEILPSLFAELIIPPAVLSELQHANAPEAVRKWARKPPTWLTVLAPARVDRTLHLGEGEREAICLGAEIQAALLLMDDRRARREAQARGLSIAGTLNIIEAAAKRRLIDLPATIAKLRQTNFHIADRIIQRILQENAESESAQQAASGSRGRSL